MSEESTPRITASEANEIVNGAASRLTGELAVRNQKYAVGKLEGSKLMFSADLGYVCNEMDQLFRVLKSVRDLNSKMSTVQIRDTITAAIKALSQFKRELIEFYEGCLEK